MSPSGFADWKRGGTRQKRLTDTQLITLISAVHQESKQAYGSPRVYDELKDREYSVSKERVERLMRENDIRARHKRRYRVTTDSKHSVPVAENLLNREFTPAAPNQTWTGDITYVAAADGWLYLAVVLDLYDRSVIGWAMREHMKTDLVQDAPTMACFRRHPLPGVMFHSDRGSQYASDAYQKQLQRSGMVCSMSRKGNCWDNAPNESFFNSSKNERVYATSYATRDEAKADLFDYIEMFYNRSRRHSALGGLSPRAAYARWCGSAPQDMAA